MNQSKCEFFIETFQELDATLLAALAVMRQHDWAPEDVDPFREPGCGVMAEMQHVIIDELLRTSEFRSTLFDLLMMPPTMAVDASSWTKLLLSFAEKAESVLADFLMEWDSVVESRPRRMERSALAVRSHLATLNSLLRDVGFRS